MCGDGVGVELFVFGDGGLGYVGVVGIGVDW